VPRPINNDSFAAALAIREADEGGETGEAGSGGGNAPQKQSVPALRSSASWRSQLPKVVHDFWDTALGGVRPQLFEVVRGVQQNLTVAVPTVVLDPLDDGFRLEVVSGKPTTRDPKRVIALLEIDGLTESCKDLGHTLLG